MKKLGIIGAMAEEVHELEEKISKEEVHEIAGMRFFEGELFEKPVVLVCSGIGKVNAAICAQILIDVFHADAIVNTGIAGGLKKGICIGDIVLSIDALQHDVDASGFGYEYGQIPRLETRGFPADETLISLAESVFNDLRLPVKLYKGRILSGDQFISKKEKKEWLIETFAGDCAEMEGAAIAQCAYLNKVPYLVIRAISDQADDGADMDYAAFEKQAIQNSVLLVCGMIKKWQPNG